MAAVLLTLALVEISMRLFYARSDGFGHTLAARSWHARHWGPENSLGHRDAEPDPGQLARKQRLIVLGDSIAAGSGIDDRKDRFADRLAEALGPDWALVLLARSGWSTRDERDALARFPAAPDVLVLAYCPNDVEGAARAAGHHYEADLSVHPSWLAPLVERSHLANFLYWRLERAGIGARTDDYFSWLRRAQEDPEVERIHREEILDLVALARDGRAQMVAILFPNPRDLEGSRDGLALAARTLQEAGVPVIDLTDRMVGRPVGSLVVNESDAHPSVFVHGEAARLLAERIRAGSGGAAPSPQPSSP